MFNIATMKTALFGQIAFRNPDDPAYENLASALTTSATGMFFEDYNELVTVKNLVSIAENYDGYNVDTWLIGSTYSIGDFAKLSGIVWESVTDANTGNDPSTDDGTNWKLPVNDWLTQKVNASISKVVNRMTRNKKNKESTKTLLENVQLFDGAGRFQDTITASGRFVGLELTPKRINNIAMVLDYIGLQFSEIQTDLTIYVFHSSRVVAIDTQDITTLAANSFHWEAGTIDNLDYVDYASHIDSGGKFYVGYFEDDISGSAIRKQNQFGSGCSGCDDKDWRLYNMWNEFFGVRAIEVASGDLNGTSLWDLSKTGYQFDTNFGINLSVSVKTDITDMLVSNKDIFTDALGYQFVYDMFQAMIALSAARVNRLGDNVQNRASFFVQQLDEKDTLKTTLDEAMASLEFDFSRLTQVLPNDVSKRLTISGM